MANDVIRNKSETIRRCIRRIHEEYQNNEDNLQNFTKQDSIILNIQRACEACIDMSMHIVSEKGFGIPQSSREAFDLLQKNGIIDIEMNRNLKAMVGFRNIAVHDYQAVQLKIVKSIIDLHLTDFEKFTELINKYMQT